MSDGSWCPLARVTDVLGDRWSLLILRELSAGPLRFKTLKENIHGISMDQLSRKLEALSGHFLIVRQEFSEAPPRVQYELTDKGRSFLPLLKKMLIWSAQELWHKPGPNEKIDVALNLRTMATFFGTDTGCVEVRVRSSESVESYLVTRSEDGTVAAFFVPDDKPLPLKPDAVISTTEREWVRVMTSGNSSSRKGKFNGIVTGRKEVIRQILPQLSWLEFSDRQSDDLESPSFLEKSLSV